jgi:NADPH-dependent glutamate synthase beta subunit-like oxidoreductase
VQLILRGQDQEALEMVERDLPFPGILGRLCSAQCEQHCHRKKIEGEAVAIRALKRYVSESASRSQSRLPQKALDSGKHCAVVGSGPAGMLAAFDLLVKGHRVTVYDSEKEPGGMLRWAIPVFRLPEEVFENEWTKLVSLGVRFKGEKALGRDIHMDELSDRYDAVIIAVGCPKPKRLGIEGEDAAGVIYALDFLRQVRAGRPPAIGNRIVVIGGGDVALDAAQTALRMRAHQVLVISLESREIMPAGIEALKQAEAEGVKLDGAWGPYRILTNNGRVSEVELKRCLAVFDNFGRFAPQFDECSIKKVPADTVVIAIGQEQSSDLGCSPAACDPVTLQSADPKVFWAGDAVKGPSTIIEAMASGRCAAESVHRLLSAQHLFYGRSYIGPYESDFEIDTSRGSDVRRAALPLRLYTEKEPFEEIEKTLNMTTARQEAGRCYGCGAPFGKYRTCWFCLPCEVDCPHDALWVEIPYLLR